MKLVFCPTCADVFALRASVWRKCACGASGGQYNLDHVTATIGGLAQVFGIHNRFILSRANFLTDRDRGILLLAQDSPGDNIWWGGGPDDKQILRIPSAEGVPRSIQNDPHNT